MFVQVYCSEFDFHQLSVVQLLSEHAPRWQDVFLASDADPSEYPTGAKGNLGRLEKLHIAGSWKRVDIFREAPRLTEITLRGEIDNVPDLPWAQLLTFTYFGAPAADCFSLLTHGSNIRTATFRIDSRGMDFPEPRQLASSDVRSITFELAVDTSLHVGRFFDSLTLPCLESFAFCRHDDATIQPIWAQNQFLALAHRSQFNTHLTRLEIHAVITDEELLNCLAVLSKLEELEISDSPGEDHILITDTLLRGLLYEPAATTLVSHLQFLHLTSVLGFTDALYRAVVISRVEEVTLEPGGVFETQLWWYAARHHDVSADTLDSLAALHAEGRLGFHSGIVSPDGTAEPDCVEGQGDTSADGDDTSSADADRWYYCESSTERDLLASMDREYEADPDSFIGHHRDSD